MQKFFMWEMQKNRLAILILLAALGSSCKSPVCLTPNETGLPHGELWSEGTLRIVLPFNRMPVLTSRAELCSAAVNQLFQVKLHNDSDKPIRWAPERLWRAELFNADGTQPKLKRRQYPQILTPFMPVFRDLPPHQEVQLDMQQTLSLPQMFDSFELSHGLYYLVITYDPMQIWNTATLSRGAPEYLYRNQGIFTNKVVSAPIPLVIR
jgi:hypothetical protein